MKKDAAELVSSALIGNDYRTVVLGEHSYVIPSPTIKRLSGAAYYISQIKINKKDSSVLDVLMAAKDFTNMSLALSYFVNGDESLRDTFNECKYEEVVRAVNVAFSMIDIQDFQIAVSLIKCAGGLIARQR